MKTTGELEQKIRSSKDPSVLRGKEFSSPALRDYLHSLLDARQLTAGKAIQLCNIDRTYGYQMFNGTRTPTRSMLITLALQLRLTEQEAQRLFKLAGRPVLYARNRQDAAVLYCLSHRLTPAQSEELLLELGESGYGAER